jgi:hypothetical protein
MAYNPRHVVRAVRDQLALKPCASLAAVSAVIRVDRHTIARTLREVEGRSFSEIQSEIVLATLAGIRSAPQPRQLKETAAALACSPRVAAKWIERLESSDLGDSAAAG